MQTPDWAIREIDRVTRNKSQELNLGISIGDLGTRKLNSIPNEIFEIKNLRELNLQGNDIENIPSDIANLSNLLYLNLSNNKLSELPKEINKLRKLKILNLGGNLFSNLIDSILDLNELEILNLYGNKFTFLPENLSRLNKLLSLHLSNNFIEELPYSIAELENIKELYLSGNFLSDLPDSFFSLQNLRKLNLSKNKFVKLPDRITELKQLEWLDLGSNQIGILPTSISELKNLKSLILTENPLLTPPVEVAIKGIDAIREYYRQLGDGYDYLYEAKILLLGEGGAGKTTLAHKIISPEYSLKDEKSTEGIDVLKWHFPLNDTRAFKANIWDFGGQEIYHSTHQFFLTKRSLYILVADTRKEDTDFYYWLNIVELLSDNSPLLIVKNEKQDRHREINERQLRGQFENLRGVLATNLATNRDLEKVQNEIKHLIKGLPHVGSPLPKTWVAVREILEKDIRNYIFLDEYVNICKQNGFTELKDILQLSGYLHDLGVFLHFQDDDLLKRTVILKPKWGTDAAYKVLDNQNVIRNLGHFTRADLNKIWDTPDYADMHGELLQLMMKFKLCYEIPSSAGTYIAPQLLTENQLQYNWDDKDNLILKYTYDFMPKGIITQFIVVMHPYILNQKYVWKSGVVLEKDNTKAEIIEYYGKREISIRISGMHKKELMAVIMHELDKIHISYRRLNFNKLIPCNCVDCRSGIKSTHYYRFDRLQKFVEDKQERIQCQQSYEMVNVRTLIDDVFGEDYDFEFEENLEYLEKLRGETMSKEPKVTISVSGNAKIENVIVNSQVNSSFNKIEEAKISDELKGTLKQLVSAVELMKESMSSKSAAQVTKYLDELIEETVKDKPNPKWYEVSINGLIKAAENIGKVGKPVINYLY